MGDSGSVGVSAAPDAAAASALLPEDVAALAEHLSRVELNVDQQDRVMAAFIASASDERRVIARLYAQYFRDPVFVNRLSARHSALTAQRAGASVHTNPSLQLGAPQGQRAVMLRELRSKLDTALCRLSGPGPHTLEFGAVLGHEVNAAVIALYASQFKYPDGPALNQLVQTPKNLSTRTRKKITGNYSWYVAAVETGEIAAAVTVTIHKLDSETHFVDVPLFATGLGYQHIGLARLLNAGLQEHCHRTGCAFILVSADPAAVPFWKRDNMGPYTDVTPQLRARLDWALQHELASFSNAQLLVWHPPKDLPRDANPGWVDAALQRMNNFVIRGPAQFPQM